ncbi:MAG: hypothetical protein Q7U38_00255 [Methylobacter sp.]|nr:hypothetical protein [Methylobacter sp.]MDP2097369.1 hypothetical protein [Methylobacter sp.]MDP2428565.1 hypothetical protein [Methylobacter sp.]MDP3056401.1 hypothetical protein [Methylobacter sp.]MDP3363147.1 hypothetical protein [Methylobacter sp.]
MNRFFLILALFISHTFINPAFAQTASFTTQDNLLTLPAVQVSDNTRFENVVVRITSFGTIATDDPAVGSDIEFNLAANALYLPQVTVDGVLYSRISLTGLNFVVVSLDGISVDSGEAGNHALDIVVTALGNTLPPIRVDNVPKPETQNEFCSDEVYNQFQQSVEGFTGTWQITTCSFNGTNGLIDAILTITSPMSMTVPYSVQYTYVTQ